MTHEFAGDDLDWLTDDPPTGSESSPSPRLAESDAPDVQRPIPEHLHWGLSALLNRPVEPKTQPRIIQLRQRFPRAYAPWSPEEDTLLLGLHQAGFGVGALSEALRRQPGGVHVRTVLLTQGEDAVRAMNEERQQRREKKAERRTAPPAGAVAVPAQQVEVKVALVAPHFEAWMALVGGGTTVRIMDGNRCVALLSPPAAPPVDDGRGRRSR